MNASKSNSRLRILVLSFTPSRSEPRALKQIRLLAQTHAVTSAGFGEPAVDGVPHIALDPSPPLEGLMKLPLVYTASLVLRFYSFLSLKDPRTSSALRQLSGETWDIIIAHDVLTVPLARALNPRVGVLVDLHEYAPRQEEHSWKFRRLIAPYFRWILRKHVSKCAAVTTVSQGIVDEYRREFGIESALVINATPFHELQPSPPHDPIRLVHSGIPAPHRKLEVMIDAVKQTKSNVQLDLYLMPTNDDYMSFLRNRANGDPRIRFRDPVPYDELVETLNDYDIGLSLIAPTTFNLAWCLPNKFFDFVQARLGVIIGPSPEMVNFVNTYGFGLVAEAFTAEALAKVLDDLTPKKITDLKSAADSHARDLSGEQQSRVWGEVVERMIEEHAHTA